VRSVTLNGDTLTADFDAPQWYTDSITLLHQPQGNELAVTACDSADNCTSSVALIWLNRTPVFTDLPRSTFVLYNQLYTDSVAGIDPDGDTLTATLHSGPPAMVIQPDGTITWAPQPTDSGSHTITIRLFDGYQPVYTSVNLLVTDSAGAPNPLRFAIAEEDFPLFLQADDDLLQQPLAVISGSGVPPYRYNALLRDKDSLLLNSSTNNLLLWSPGPADIGYQQLIVSVADNFGGADTLYPRILVVPPNRPCSLSSSHSIPQSAGGVLDVNSLQHTATIRFTIHDPDQPLIEKHSVTIAQSGSGVSSTIDSARTDTFSVQINPAARSGYDTLVVMITDRGGLSDTLQSILYFGYAPDSVALIAPAAGETGVSVDPLLSFAGYDSDDDIARYIIYTGTTAEALTPVDTVLDTTAQLYGLATATQWFWQVAAQDWKGTVFSPIHTFTTEN
jgi:hypothetical protein